MIDDGENIMVVLSSPSGVGKTTLSINIAGALSAIGYKVLLIDADPQGSALDWAAKRTSDLIFNSIAIGVCGASDEVSSAVALAVLIHIVLKILALL